MDYFNEDDGRFNFGLDKFFETQEDASDFEITAFLNGSKAKQTCYKDKSDVKRTMTFIKDISEENGKQNNCLWNWTEYYAVLL